MLVYKWRLLPDFWFNKWVFFPRKHPLPHQNFHLVPGFTPSVAWLFHLRWYLHPIEISRVFVMWCQSTSHLTRHVYFVMYTCHIQSYIRTFMHTQYIHPLHFSMSKLIHLKGHRESCLTVSLQFKSWIKSWSKQQVTASLWKQLANTYSIFSKVWSQCVWSRDVTTKHTFIKLSLYNSSSYMSFVFFKLSSRW